MIEYSRIDGYRENNRLEAKSARGGLPKSIWQTYSAFANTSGGCILLGVDENPDKSLSVSGLDDPGKLVAEIWSNANNSGKVSINVLREKHVRVVEAEGKQIVEIEVPRAERADKPVFLNNDIWNAYRRNGEGDFRCSKASVKAMIRDSANVTQDMLVLEKMPMTAIDYETVKGYRNVMRVTRVNHVWDSLDDDEFLFKLGAIGRSDDDKLSPTAAGILMFGFEHEIVREFPNFFLDYQEHFDEGLRWTDRITSTSGEWSGNIFDFYKKAINKLVQHPGIKKPFKVENGFRVDDTPVHVALREALANCLINSDYYGEAGVVIKSYSDRIAFENPGCLRIRIEEAISGGISSPRNAVLMKMFNLLDIGERAGSGIPSIYSIWEAQQFGVPQLTERLHDFERVCLLLPIKSADKKVPIKSADKKVPVKSAGKNGSGKSHAQKDLALKVIGEKGEVRSADLAVLLDVGERRARDILAGLAGEGLIVADGSNRNRSYRPAE